MVRHWTGITACTLILSGGIGNIIDRIVHGYVVDMFDLQLFSYPVFNLADCCVVVGAILGGIYYLFLYENTTRKRRSLTMHTIRLTPLEEDTGTRLDSFLSRRVEGLTRSAAARLLAEGCVTCDGAVPGKATASPAGRSCA